MSSWFASAWRYVAVFLSGFCSAWLVSIYRGSLVPIGSGAYTACWKVQGRSTQLCATVVRYTAFPTICQWGFIGTDATASLISVWFCMDHVETSGCGHLRQGLELFKTHGRRAADRNWQARVVGSSEFLQAQEKMLKISGRPGTAQTQPCRAD